MPADLPSFASQKTLARPARLEPATPSLEVSKPYSSHLLKSTIVPTKFGDISCTFPMVYYLVLLSPGSETVFNVGTRRFGNWER